MRATWKLKICLNFNMLDWFYIRFRNHLHCYWQLAVEISYCKQQQVTGQISFPVTHSNFFGVWPQAMWAPVTSVSVMGVKTLAALNTELVFVNLGWCQRAIMKCTPSGVFVLIYSVCLLNKTCFEKASSGCSMNFYSVTQMHLSITLVLVLWLAVDFHWFCG